MKKVPLTVLSLALIVPLSLPLVITGCDSDGKSGKDKILADLGPKSKKLSEIKSKKSEMTPEQLAEARKKAGFVDPKEIAAENAKMFEKGAREYVKTRMEEYRTFMKDFRANIDQIEKKAAEFPKAKDPQAAFDKWRQEFGKEAKELMKRYDAMTGNGAEGGNTQAILGKAFRGWENLKADLTPDIAANERFPKALEELRNALTEVDKALDDIDKDESLVINKFYDEKKGEGGDEKDKKGKKGKKGK